MALGACGSESTKKEAFTQSDSSISEGGCDGNDIGTVERRVRYQSASVKGDGECLAQDQMRTCDYDCTWSEWSGDYSVESCKVEGLASCDGMPHGTTQTRPRYETMTVAAGATCKKQDQTRACEDGTWSAWSGSFTFEACSVDGTTSCGSSPDGATEEQKRYEAAVVDFGTMCKSEQQTRACNKGSWSKWSGTYMQENCRVADALSCGNTPHGKDEERERSKSSLVEANEKCESEKQTRTCTNGKFGEWTGTFAALTCEVKGQRRCGETLHNQSETRTLFENASVDFGKECVSVKQTRVCKDAKFEDWTPSSTFTATSCKVKDPLPCGATAHNGTRTRLAYKESSPKFGTTCESTNQTSTCFNGAWSDYTGPAGFAALTCTVQAPAACGAVPHNGTTTRTYYEQAAPEFGTTCKSELQTGKCFNGALTWNGTYTAATCTVAPPASCEGTASGTKETRKRFEKLSVPAGTTCRGQDQTRTCTNGKWSAWTGTYTELTCKVLGRTCSRGLGGGADILDGESDSRVRYEAAFPATTCKMETQTRLCKDGTFAAWSGTYKALGCSPLPAPSTKVASCRDPNNDEPKCREWTGTNLDGNKSSCTGGRVWDATRGCPTEGTAIGKCSGNIGSGPTSNFFYIGTTQVPSVSCLGTGGTWTDL